jgi:PPOX class probable F420-dependent enzyme
MNIPPRVMDINRSDSQPSAKGPAEYFTGTVASYPERAKSINIRRNPHASMTVMSDTFHGEWVQVDGHAKVIDLPEALDGLVEYFQVIKGEHDDWDAYRQAMVDQGKILIRLQIERWSLICKGGFPARLISTD